MQMGVYSTTKPQKTKRDQTPKTRNTQFMERVTIGESMYCLQLAQDMNLLVGKSATSWLGILRVLPSMEHIGVEMANLQNGNMTGTLLPWHNGIYCR